MIYVWPVVIFVTFLGICYGLNRLWKRGEAEYQRVMLKDRLYQADAQLPRAGRFRICCDTPPDGSHQGTCPNSVMNTGQFLPYINEPPPFQGASLIGQPQLRAKPLAGGVGQHIREIEWLQEQAEQAIPERWR